MVHFLCLLSRNCVLKWETNNNFKMHSHIKYPWKWTKPSGVKHMIVDCIHIENFEMNIFRGCSPKKAACCSRIKKRSFFFLCQKHFFFFCSGVCVLYIKNQVLHSKNVIPFHSPPQPLTIQIVSLPPFFCKSDKIIPFSCYFNGPQWYA